MRSERYGLDVSSDTSVKDGLEEDETGYRESSQVAPGGS